MKISVLAENTASCENYGCEHGLSLYIQTDAENILFDMGQTDLFLKNAQKLGIDLASVDFAVLSHGHYDHGGGIKTFLEINKTAKVFVSRNVFGDYYNGSEKYIGLDKSLIKNDRIVLVDDEYNLTENISLLSCNGKTRPFLTQSFGLNKKVNGEFLPDDFLHEQYMLVKENGKTYLFSGCSHKGVLNIQKWFKPDFLIGGFHLSKIATDGGDAGELDGIAQTLLCDETVYYTAHCTGVEQFKHLKSKMKDRLFYLSSGDCVNM